jgi:uncharacterized protein (TIGR00730 family)
VSAICVFCASSSTIDRRYLDLAAEVGAELARRGHTLVSGGGSVSCMGRLAEAARAGGAHTVGVIPKNLVDWEVADEDADELIVAGDMRARKGEMDRRSDAFLVLPGGLGTLEELFEVWTGRTLGEHDKPLAVLDADGVLNPVRELVRHLIENGFARPKVMDAVFWTSSVTEAFDHLDEAVAPMVPTSEEILEAEP